MSGIRMIEGEPRAQDLRVAVVAARFNGVVVERLIRGALEVLKQHGVAESGIELVRVPGAFELPAAIAALLRRGRCDAVIALGAVIRGETPHFDYVAGECARGIARLALECKVPVIFGVLTTDTMEQALERAVEGAPAPPAAGGMGKDTTRGGNKGAEAALAALEMMDLLHKLAE